MECMEDTSDSSELGQAESKRRREERKRVKMMLLESGCSIEELASETNIKVIMNQSRTKQNRRKLRSKKQSNECDGECSSSTSKHLNSVKKANNINHSSALINETDVGLSEININFKSLAIQQSPSNEIGTDETHLLTTSFRKQKMKNKTMTQNVIVDISKSSSNRTMSSPLKFKQKTPDSVKKKPNKNQKNRNTEDDNSQNRNVDKEKHKFAEYLPLEEVKKGLASGELYTGFIRINPKDYKLSYITNPIRTEQDFLIISIKDRNGALEGDNVVVKLKPESEWKSKTQKTATVVHILEKNHPRTTIGYLKLMPDKNQRFALFIPRDSRVPRIKIPFTDWPVRFYELADKYEQVLFLGKITKWSEPKYAIGILIENVGMSGDIRTETRAILAENCLNVEPYSEEMKKYFPQTGEINPEEYYNRLDLRKECIFTIDPATARDLDDAMSCKELPNGNFEIGVHISDVTYYLKENTPLDEIVSQKATSIYMVESVYHMLPKELCMICSLLPGEDKLAFSVFWEMTPEAKVVSHKFSRTVINSCTQLAYEHAQMMIENPNKKFTENELPKIHNGFKPDDICRIVNNLQKLAVILRQSRFNSGALRIDQPKVQFSIDVATCLPTTYTLYENKECHRLIEEFMLLANITVATRLRNDYSKIAFLRSHPSPNDYMMIKLQSTLETVGIHLDVSNAGGLQQSLWKYDGDDFLSKARMMVLNLLCAKPMTRAHYFCANNSNEAESYWHYALSIPLYTHFTSPIRRFADIIVHRQLAGSLGYTEKPNWTEEYVSKIAANCNKQKFNAKRAGEQSIDLYLYQYIAQNQPVIEKAVVMDLKDNSFDAIIISNGLNVRIYLNNLDDDVNCYFKNEDEEQNSESDEDKKYYNLTLEWPADINKPAKKQIIAMFSIITVSLSKQDKVLKLDTKLIRPDAI